MPQIAAITINDGATTPVAFTFNPLTKDVNDVYILEQGTPAPTNPLGAVRVGVRTRRLNGNGKDLEKEVHELTLSIDKPTLETMSVSDGGYVPAPRVSYKNVARVVLNLPVRSTKQERKDTRVFLANLLAHATVVSLNDDLQALWG